MTTAQITPQDAYDVTTVDGDALTELFSTVNARRTGDSGVVWFLSWGTGADAPLLVAGVRGDVGCLSWEFGVEMSSPADGANAERVPYFTYEGHDFEQEPGVEVPIETVYTAVREFATTGQRPSCVDWRPAS